MATDLKITDAPAASALTGAELLPCAQGGVSKSTTTGAIAALAGTIKGTLGTTDKVVPRANGTGGLTAQGSDLIVNDPASGWTTIDTVSGATIQFLKQIGFPNGSLSVPGLVFAPGSGVNSGMLWDPATGSAVYEINGEARFGIEVGSYRLRLSTAWEIAWSATSVATANPPDTGLKRAAAARLVVTDGQGGLGSINGTRSATSSAAGATTAQLPNPGDSCVHTNTTTGFTHFAANVGGTIKSVQLA